VGAAIVLGDHLDVFVMVASVQLLLDTEVGEVNRLIEVRQVVFVGPGFDFAGVQIRSPVAVRPPAIRLLQPLLVLALEFVLEDDAADVRAMFPKTLLFTQVRAIELDVVRQLTRPAHAGVERLLARIVAVAAMGFQEVMTPFCECQGALAAVQFDELGEPFVAQMPQVWLPPVDRLVTGIAEVAFGHDSKRTDGRERATVVAIQFVPVVAIEHDFAFKPARQLEAVDKRVSRIDTSFARVTIANVFVAVAQVILFAVQTGLITHVNPRHLHVADVIAAISISGVKVHNELRRQQTRDSRSRRCDDLWASMIDVDRLWAYSNLARSLGDVAGERPARMCRCGTKDPPISVIASAERTSKYVGSHTLPSTCELRMIAFYL